MEDIHVFLENHINTKRAQKSTPVVISRSNFLDNQLTCLAQYKLNFQYPNTRIAPSFIKIGVKNNRVCVRVDELERHDRGKFIDYFADDVSQLKKLLTHLAKLQRDYDRTIWFLRAQLIPALFKIVMDFLISTKVYS